MGIVEVVEVVEVVGFVLFFLLLGFYYGKAIIQKLPILRFAIGFVVVFSVIVLYKITDFIKFGLEGILSRI